MSRGKVMVADYELTDALYSILGGIEKLMLSAGINEYSKEGITVTRHAQGETDADPLIGEPDAFGSLREYVDNAEVKARLDDIFGPSAPTPDERTLDAIATSIVATTTLARLFGRFAGNRSILLAGLSSKCNEVQFKFSTASYLIQAVLHDLETTIEECKEFVPNAW